MKNTFARQAGGAAPIDSTADAIGVELGEEDVKQVARHFRYGRCLGLVTRGAFSAGNRCLGDLQIARQGEDTVSRRLDS